MKARATGVNRTSCATRAAKPFFARLITGLIRPKVTILGNEFAGEVETRKEIGNVVISLERGDGCSP